MSYLQYFGFDSEPFGHAPSSRFYYASAEHTQALRRLLHCVHSMQGLAVLVGDMGRGKTTLARQLLEALPEAEYAAALVVIVHREVAPLWLIRHIASQLGVMDPAGTAPEVIGQLYAQLMALHEAGRRAVVLIDEAQMLETRALMEEFRGLLNLEVPGHKLISFVFFGLPSIEDTLRLDPPLAQRVAMRYALQPLDAQACAAYITHRLEVVGARWHMFSQGALEAIHHYSQGVPRVINTLCDNLLLEMFLAGGQLAEREHAVAVAENLNLISGADAAPLPVAPWLEQAASLPEADMPGANDAHAAPASYADAPAAVLQSPDTPDTPDTPEAHASEHGADAGVLQFAVEPAYAPSAPGEVHEAQAPISATAPIWSMPSEAQAQAPMMPAAQPPEAGAAPAVAPVDAPDPAAEDWSGLMAVGSLLTNTNTEPSGASEASATASQALATPEQQPIGQGAPDDVGPEDYAAQNALATTSYGTLNLDEVTALLAQIRQS